MRSLIELSDQPRFKNLELTGKYKSIAIFVYGIEKFNHEQRENFVKLLNFLKDRLTTIVYPVVIWGTSSFVAQLARNAPDFWSWKGHSFSFPSPTLSLPLLRKKLPEAPPATQRNAGDSSLPAPDC